MNTSTDAGQRAPFQREERFIVVKRKLLNGIQEAALRANMERLDIGTVECVVVESDWPEYETVWAMIEARCTGEPAAFASPVTPAAAVDRGALVSAATELLERMSSTYKARNGREVGVQGDDGEKVWLVHSDEIEALRRALTPAAATIPEGMGRLEVIEAIAGLAENGEPQIFLLESEIERIADEIILQQTLKARKATPAPILPATIPGGDREALSPATQRMEQILGTPFVMKDATSTGEASDEVLADAGGVTAQLGAMEGEQYADGRQDERNDVLDHLRAWDAHDGDKEPGWLGALIGQIESCEHIWGESANPVTVDAGGVGEHNDRVAIDTLSAAMKECRRVRDETTFSADVPEDERRALRNGADACWHMLNGMQGEILKRYGIHLPVRLAHTAPVAGEPAHENDAPEARLDMVRVVLEAIAKGEEPKALAKAGLDFCNLTQAEREAMRGEDAALSTPKSTAAGEGVGRG